MKDRMRVILGAAVILLVIAGISLYVTQDEEINLPEFLAIVVIPLILVLGAAKILKEKAKNAKSGLPAEDELSRKINYKAGYYAYISSIGIALSTMWASEFFAGLEARHVAEIVILLPGMVFIGTYLYMSRKGD